MPTEIQFMQSRIFRQCMEKWKIDNKKCVAVFKKYDIWGFIFECYDSLHLEGDFAVICDIENVIKANGGDISAIS